MTQKISEIFLKIISENFVDLIFICIFVIQKNKQLKTNTDNLYNKWTSSENQKQQYNEKD